MSKFFSIFQHVLVGIVTAESVLNGMPGADKKKVVLPVVMAELQAFNQSPVPQVARVSTMIDATVAALNTTPWFKALTAQVPAPTPQP